MPRKSITKLPRTPRPNGQACFAETWPELPVHKFERTRNAPRAVSAAVMLLAHLRAGNKMSGSEAHLTIQDLRPEYVEMTDFLAISLDRVATWADSLLLRPEQNLPPPVLPSVIPKENSLFPLHPYQIETAGWCAMRMGSILNFGCGVGKTATSLAAAIGARRLGKCNDSRVTIFCPANAFGAWLPFIPEFQEVFRHVDIISLDDLHNHMHTDSRGGAMIVDESHRCKNDDANRTRLAHEIRPRYEWGICLTGSLLHTGIEPIMSIQDLACPGLSRVIDKFRLAAYLNAVMFDNVQIRGRASQKRKIVEPPKTSDHLLISYLARSTRSYTLTSPEVAKYVKMPEQNVVEWDTWEMPEWLKTAYEDKAKADIKEALERGEQMTASMAYEQSPYVWAPNVTWVKFAAALTLAMHPERIKQGLELLREEYEQDFNNEEEALAWAIPIWRQNKDRDLKKIIGLLEIPSFSAVFWAVRTEGAIDRVPMSVLLEQPDGTKRRTFRFQYAPGSDPENPKPGVKIRRVMDWLHENWDEPALVSAASQTTLKLFLKQLDEAEITYDVIDGSVAPLKRPKIVKRFDKDKFRVLVVQHKAGSESINVTRAAYSFSIDHDLSPITYDQFGFRTWRQGQTRECFHYDMVFGAEQGSRVADLRRGQKFDLRIRQKLEEEFNSAVQGLMSST
jgi:hypothetical protein